MKSRLKSELTRFIPIYNKLLRLRYSNMDLVSGDTFSLDRSLIVVPISNLEQVEKYSVIFVPARSGPNTFRYTPHLSIVYRI